MKKLKYLLLPILFLTTSCYIYRPYVEKDEKTDGKASVSPSAGSISLMGNDESAKQKTTLNPEAARQQDEKEKMKQQKKQEQEEAERQKKESQGVSGNGLTSKNMEVSPAKNTNTEGQRKRKQDINSSDTSEPQIVEKGIRGKLQPNKFYKITAREKQFKIQVDKWEGDSLVAHIIRKPQKQVKLHQDEIDEELILERRFSRPFSDLFTVGAYAAGAAAVLLIVL